MFCWHKWGRFGDPVDTATCYTKVQARVCEKCGKWHIHKVKAPWNVWFNVSVLIATIRKGGAA